VQGSQHPTARSCSRRTRRGPRCCPAGGSRAGRCRGAVTVRARPGEACPFFALLCWFSSFSSTFSSKTRASSLPSVLLSALAPACWEVLGGLGSQSGGGRPPAVPSDPTPLCQAGGAARAGPTRGVPEGPRWHSLSPWSGSDGESGCGCLSLGNAVQPQQLPQKGRGFACRGFSGGS